MESKVYWRDIVLINENYYCEEAPVEFEDESLNNISFGESEKEILSQIEKYADSNAPLYDCSKFFEYLSEKYNVDSDDIKTLMFDDFDIPRSVLDELSWGIESCGGYINGFNI